MVEHIGSFEKKHLFELEFLCASICLLMCSTLHRAQWIQKKPCNRKRNYMVVHRVAEYKIWAWDTRVCWKFCVFANIKEVSYCLTRAATNIGKLFFVINEEEKKKLVAN